MYVRISNSRGRQYLRLVQVYRDENGKVRQRHLAQLGRLDELDEHTLQGLIDSLHRFTGEAGPSGKGKRVEPQFERAREVGPEWLLSELWEMLGLADLIRRALRSSRRGFDVEAAVRLMVFNRLCDPESKLGLLRWLEGAVVFYDLTTIRIHGEADVEGDLRRYGHSKELKGPARQCVLGLVQTADGLPLDFEVFEGNVAEVKTLLPMLERCVKRYPIERVIVVADRGLLSQDNVAEVERLEITEGRTLDYILAVPAGRYRDFAALIDGLTFAEAKESVREGEWEGRRVVIAHDPERAKERRARRREKLTALTDFGDDLAAKLDAQDAGKTERGRRASDRGAYTRFSREVHEAHFSRFITPELESERFAFSVDEEAVAKAERLDGKLVLLTNVTDLQAEDIVERYKALADIERGFRVLESDIEIAPVHHYKPDRIRAHAMR